MEKEFITIAMDQFIEATGRTTNKMVWVASSSPMGQSTKVSFKIIKCMGPGSLSITQPENGKASSEKESFKANIKQS